jgi:hypothetical protein
MAEGGIFLGKSEKTDEALVGTADGIMMTRTFRRLPDDAKYSLPELLNIRGSPSNRREGVGEMDPKTLLTAERVVINEEPEVVPVAAREPLPLLQLFLCPCRRAA